MVCAASVRAEKVDISKEFYTYIIIVVKIALLADKTLYLVIYQTFVHGGLKPQTKIHYTNKRRQSCP